MKSWGVRPALIVLLIGAAPLANAVGGVGPR